jgi:hypothetical protein
LLLPFRKMDFSQRICKILSGVCSGLFYLFVDLNLPAQRKHDDIAGEESSELNRKLFECPGCDEIPQPPVFTCSSGHIVCTLCKEVGACSVCGGDYSGNARNFIVERIVTTNNFPCRFHHEGCDKVLNVAELLEHQKECFHRHCKCGIVGKGCDGSWVGSVNGLYAHLLISHGMFYIFRDKKASFKAEFDPASNAFLRFDGPIVMLKVTQGKNYMIRTVFRKELDIVFTFIIGLFRDENDKTPESISKRGTASIKLHQRDGLGPAQTDLTTPEKVWIGPVNTVDDNPLELFEEGKGLLLPWSELLEDGARSKTFLTWELQINIFPHKEAPPEEVNKKTISKNGIKELFPTLLRPFFMSTWAVVAPVFTLAIILIFVFLV